MNPSVWGWPVCETAVGDVIPDGCEGDPLIVTLTTDFGLSDGYVGAVKGVLLSLAPHVTVIDLCHVVSPGDVRHAAFLLYQATPTFPTDSIHVAVVDPGVGSDRRIVAVRTTWGTYVAPDNGLLTLILANSETQEMVNVTNPVYWRARTSATFHGRDIFAPVAAHLANGVAVSRLGQPLTDPVMLSLPEPEFPAADTVVAHVLHVDDFGNLILNIRADQLPRCPVFEVMGHTIRGLHRTYADGIAGQLIAYVGSTHDHVEIAVPQGHAGDRCGATVGTRVLIRNEAE